MTTLIDNLSGDVYARTNEQRHVTVSNSSVAENLRIRHGSGVFSNRLIQPGKADVLVVDMV